MVFNLTKMRSHILCTLNSSVFALLLFFASCTSKQADSSSFVGSPISSRPADSTYMAAGIYAAYPGPQQEELTLAPQGYEAYYISLYNRHGSRYQPSNDRYQHTLDRLQEAHQRGALTPYGESLLPQIQQLCDSCLGHGGQLSSVGQQQLKGIGQRMANRFPEIFSRTMDNGSHRCHVRARASIVPRCSASAQSFLAGLNASNVSFNADTANMAYIAYDTPAMRQLGAKDAPWQSDYREYMRTHVDKQRIISAIFADAADLDSLQTVIDLYWLAVGMQDVDVPGCDLSQVFTTAELLSCWQCVNYRMYVCNACCPQSQGIPAASASTLLQNIIERADEALDTDTVAADLRFGHDSNLLRLLALMRIQGATAQVEHPAQAWLQWPDYALSPMGANLQLIFYRPTVSNASSQSTTASETTPTVLVKLLHNEGEVLLDAPLQPVTGPYYDWRELREYLLAQLSATATDATYTINIQ